MIIRRDICLGGLAGLSPTSPGYGLDRAEGLARLAEHGFAGVVAWDSWDAIRAAGLVPCGMGRVLDPAEALPLARRHADAGLDFTTLHVGTGFESDAGMDRLAAAVLEARAISGHALHIETHRATMTQDIRRTCDLVARFPALSFTLDFSHWYTGHEMTYGGEYAARLAQCDPVFARTGSLQLRIGTTGAIQRLLDPSSAHHADHCTALDRCLAVRLAAPDPPQVLSAAPELLPAMMGEGADARPIHYAEEPERSDRFAEAIALASLAQQRLAAVLGKEEEKQA
jgi:hypothetical protein